jgi:hypothetical protein
MAKCETCDGMGKVPDPAFRGRPHGDGTPVTMTCPDCRGTRVAPTPKPDPPGDQRDRGDHKRKKRKWGW